MYISDQLGITDVQNNLFYVQTSKFIHIAPSEGHSPISQHLTRVARGSSLLDEVTRSASRLSIYSNSSDATSGFESETQSQVDLNGVSLAGSSRLCTSLPLLPVIPGSPSATDPTPPDSYAPFHALLYQQHP